MANNAEKNTKMSSLRGKRVKSKFKIFCCWVWGNCRSIWSTDNLPFIFSHGYRMILVLLFMLFQSPDCNHINIFLTCQIFLSTSSHYICRKCNVSLKAYFLEYRVSKEQRLAFLFPEPNFFPFNLTKTIPLP